MLENSEDIISSELEKLVTQDRLNRIDSVLNARTRSLTIVLEDIVQSHNISAVMRSAEAFGVGKVYLLNTEKGVKKVDLSEGISLGTEKWLDVEVHTDRDSLISNLKNEGFTLVALVPPRADSPIGSDFSSLNEGELLPVSLLPFEKPIALLFGNEVRGLSEELIEKSNIKAFIPMYGFVESFNISVACAITLFCSTIEPAKPERRTMPLDRTEQKFIRRDWIKKSIQNVEVIIKSLAKRNSST